MQAGAAAVRASPESASPLEGTARHLAMPAARRRCALQRTWPPASYLSIVCYLFFAGFSATSGPAHPAVSPRVVA